MSRMLVVVQNVIQYYSLRPLLINVAKNRLWDFDIFVYGLSSNDSSGFYEISVSLKKAIEGDGFKVIKKLEAVKNKKYKVCLAPYQNMVEAKIDYLIGYNYGSASSKPSTFAPEWKMSFHGFLINDTNSADLLSVYGKTYILPNLRLNQVNKQTKHTKKGHKKTVLYLPTYGDINNIDEVCEGLARLKKSYHIIAKGHHGTEYLTSEKKKKSSLQNTADEYFGPESDIDELFKRADVVLSDNSGAIFDALYIGVPVCICAKNINKQFADIDTLQSKLVQQGVMPYSKKANSKSLDSILKKAMERDIVSRQLSEAEKLFPNRSGGVESWVKVLAKYMNDEISLEYIQLHNFYIKSFNQVSQKAAKLDSATKCLQDTQYQLKLCKNELDNYRKAKLYRLSHKIYETRDKIRSLIK